MRANPVARLGHVLCLDFEASAFGPGGFPIEVAVADPATRAVRSWLIRPIDLWLGAGEWSEESAAVHKLTRHELLRHGLPVTFVAAELSALCKGKQVLSDAIDLDSAWLTTLYRATHHGDAPFVLFNFHAFAVELCWRLKRKPDIAYQAAELGAQKRFPVTHRAAADARCRAEMLRLIAGCP